jgi:dihydrodipicolinate synthase (EC 4.2.1.52)
MFEGVIPAIITPFTKEDGVDEEGLKENIEFLEENGVHGIVPCGTTGESATMSHEEHKKVVDIAVDTANVPVLAGSGSNSTKETLELSKYAEDTGADGVLVITPYYNKPTDAGLIKHFSTLAESIDIPIILYNVPSRTGINMKPSVVAELSKIDGIDGIKEASGSISQISQIIELTRDEDFEVLSGNDDQAFPIFSLGGVGVISVVANVLPKELVEMYEYFKSGDLEKAREKHYDLSPIFRALFIETNPIPVKTACKMRGLAAGGLRLPLVPLSEENERRLKEVLERYIKE